MCKFEGKLSYVRNHRITPIKPISYWYLRDSVGVAVQVLAQFLDAAVHPWPAWFAKRNVLLRAVYARHQKVVTLYWDPSSGGNPKAIARQIHGLEPRWLEAPPASPPQEARLKERIASSCAHSSTTRVRSLSILPSGRWSGSVIIARLAGSAGWISCEYSHPAINSC